jgi:hypothetical protein
LSCFLTTITEPGDCGSWVVDFDGKVLYGYITAGDPGTSIGYIIPAYQAFSDIEKQTGATVTFPSPEIRSERRQTGTDAHELPATALDCIEVLQHQRPLSDAGSLSTILTSDYLGNLPIQSTSFSQLSERYIMPLLTSTDNGILDRDSSLLERSGDVTGRDRSGETAELGLSGNLALNTQSNNHTGIIQKYASRIRKKIKVSFLTPKIVSLLL